MCGFINNFLLGDNMIESIKFCLLMTISKVLAAGVTCIIILFIPSIIMMFNIGQDLYTYWHIIVSSMTIVILMLFCAKLSLTCFRCAVNITNTTNLILEKKVIQNKVIS
jgi:hypothetical protein